MTLITALLVVGTLSAAMAGLWIYVVATTPEPEYMQNLRNSKRD